MADRLEQLTSRMSRTAVALRLDGAAGARFERVAGPILKAEVNTAAVAAFGSDLKPWTKKGPRASFGYDLEGRPTGAAIVVKLRGGAWPFGEAGAGPHLVGIKRVGKKGRIKAGYIAAAGYKHPVRGPVLHPGVKGRGAIRYVFKRVRTAQRDAVAAGIHAVLEEVRRGG